MEHFYTIIAVIFTGGGFYFMTNFRIKALEVKVDQQADLKDTITRLDERVKLLIDHFINKKL